MDSTESTKQAITANSKIDGEVLDSANASQASHASKNILKSSSIDTDQMQQKRRRITAPKKKKKKEIKPKPGPILPSDIRRTYPRIFLNTFNGCDINKVIEIAAKYCTEDFVQTYRYEGVQNPYGRNVTSWNGREAFENVWRTLFKSSPDFFFEVQETRAFYDPEYRVVVASKFSWRGTRILDIKVAEKANAEVLKHKLENAGDFTTDESKLLEIVMQEKQKLKAATGHGSSEPDSASSSTAPLKKAELQVGDSLFDQTGDIALEHKVKLVIGENQIAQKREMRCKGTFIVYLDDDNKIYKVEFVYIAMDEETV